MNEWFEAEQRIERAQQLSESHCWEEALAEIEAALEINPHNASWHAHRGYILDELDRYAEAAEAYRRSLELEPGDREITLAYGANLAKQRKYTRALVVFAELARQYPGFEPAYCQRIAIYADLGRHDQAEEMFYLAQELVPECPHCFFNIGNSLAQRGQTDRALYCWERVLSIDAEYPGVRQCIALAYRAQGKLLEAHEYLLAELRDDPGNSDILFDLAELALESGKPAAAAVKLAQIIELDPSYWQAHLGLGKLLLARGEAAKAIEHFRLAEATVEGDEDQELQARMGEAYLRLGDYDRARQCLEAAIDERSPSVSVLMLLGDCYHAMGKIGRAEACFRRVLAIENTNPFAHHNLAVCFFRVGNYKAGLKHCLESLRHKPDYGLAMQKTVIAYMRLGQWREGRRMLKKALEKQPNSRVLRKLWRRWWVYRFNHLIRSLFSHLYRARIV
jgi:tetratricopeptide (TPR) repeat protein